MADKITYDKNGVMGPAFALMFYSHRFSNDEVNQVITLLKKNCSNVIGKTISGRKNFWELKNNGHDGVTLISTQLLQELQTSENYPYHQSVVTKIIPPMFNAIKLYIPEIKVSGDQQNYLFEWMARVLEGYMSEENINNECQYQDLIVDTQRSTQNANVWVGWLIDLLMPKNYPLMPFVP